MSLIVLFPVGSAPQSITGAIAQNQQIQAEAAIGILLFSGASEQAQQTQAQGATGILSFGATVEQTQQTQAQVLSAELLFTGTASELQEIQLQEALGGSLSPVEGTISIQQEPQEQMGYIEIGVFEGAEQVQRFQRQNAFGIIERMPVRVILPRDLSPAKGSKSKAIRYSMMAKTDRRRRYKSFGVRPRR